VETDIKETSNCYQGCDCIVTTFIKSFNFCLKTTAISTTQIAEKFGVVTIIPTAFP
jgi:hypothetical protein